MRIRFVLLFAAVLAIAVMSKRVASQIPLLTMKGAMSQEEYAATGVGGLTASQQAALDRWLNRWTLLAMNVSCGGSYSDTKEGHFIRDNADGTIIILDDDSIWLVEPIDRVDSSLWLATEDVIVLEARQEIAGYGYTLINVDQKEKVLAKYLGKE